VGPRAGLDGRKISSPDRPALSQSLYRLSYRAHEILKANLIYTYTIHCALIGRYFLSICVEKAFPTPALSVSFVVRGISRLIRSKVDVSGEIAHGGYPLSSVQVYYKLW